MEPIIRAIFEKIFCEVPQAVRQLTGGADNLTYRVTLLHAEKVIRMNKDYLDTYRKEAWAMEKAAEKCVRVPKIDAIGTEQGHDYIIMEFIAGVTAEDYKSDKIALSVRLGELARRINAIPVTGYGWSLELDPSPRFNGDWREWVRKDLAYIFAPGILDRLDILPPEAMHRVENRLAAMAEWEMPGFLSHNDLNFTNVIVMETDELCLIDWSNAGGHPAPYWDLGNMMSTMEDAAHFHAFVHGYSLDAKEFERIRDDVLSVAVTHALRAARWAATDHPVELDKFRKRVRKLARLI